MGRKRIYRYEIGDILSDRTSGKLEILEKLIAKSQHSAYKYKCLLCGNVDIITDSELSKGDSGCNVCCKPSKKILIGYNDLWTTNSEVAELLVNKTSGYTLSAGSNKTENFLCKKCGSETSKPVFRMVEKITCSKCSDGISYPEKFMMELLNQLQLDYEKEKVFTWSKNVKNATYKLRGNKKYDFYLKDINCIIETHGEQHNKKGFNHLSSRSLSDEKENDILKENLAMDNGISLYITIDCSKSEMEYIMNNIIRSQLASIYNFDKIDWLKCHEFACNSLIKVASEHWMNLVGTTKDIGKIMNLHPVTVIKYLKIGRELGLCDYDPEKSTKLSGYISSQKRRRKVIQLTLNGVYIQEHGSMREAQELLGLQESKISNVCKGKRNHTGGFKWMYKEDYEKYIEQKNTYSNEMVLS